MVPGKAVRTIFLLFFPLLLSLFRVQDVWSADFPLDGEAVFCLYYRLSGRPVDLQDIEEFCHQSGRPAYTSFKPSEMFTKRDIREVRKKIEEKIRRMEEDSLFIWRFKASLIPHGLKSGGCRITYRDKELPQATPYIFAEISKEGRIYLRKALDTFRKERSDHAGPQDLEICVSLRPEKVARRYQQRNIALEDVSLPIRFVIFHPVDVKVLDKRMTIQE